VSAGNPGVITVQTNSLSDVGTYTATLDVKLTNYSTVAHFKASFSITIGDPCLTTMLALPTTLLPVQIASLSGVQDTQTFMPATDTAASSAALPSLCGPRTYKIVESVP
jgi:hypothetical protein